MKATTVPHSVISPSRPSRPLRPAQLSPMGAGRTGDARYLISVQQMVIVPTVASEAT